MRVVGIDCGKKRVGLAVSDPLGLFARPLGTYAPAESLEELRSLMAQDGITRIVIGWPASPDGTNTTAEKVVQPYIDQLKAVFPEVTLIKWDEYGTSLDARELIRESGARKKKRRNRPLVDAVAASLILGEYLRKMEEAD